MENKLFTKNKTLSDESKLNIFIGCIYLLFVCCIFFINRNKFPQHYFTHLLCKCFFYTFIALAIGVILYVLKNRKTPKSKKFYLLWIISFLFSLPHIPFLFDYETTNIGGFYEGSQYKEKYIVLMSREPQSVVNRKIYTLPAEIERRSDHSGVIEVGNGEYEELEALNYHINYLYFPNGGYLSFDYDEAYESPEYCVVILNKERKVTDYKGNEYYVTLTDKMFENNI